MFVRVGKSFYGISAGEKRRAAAKERAQVVIEFSPAPFFPADIIREDAMMRARKARKDR